MRTYVVTLQVEIQEMDDATDPEILEAALDSANSGFVTVLGIEASHGS